GRSSVSAVRSTAPPCRFHAIVGLRAAAETAIITGLFWDGSSSRRVREQAGGPDVRSIVLPPSPSRRHPRGLRRRPRRRAPWHFCFLPQIAVVGNRAVVPDLCRHDRLEPPVHLSQLHSQPVLRAALAEPPVRRAGVAGDRHAAPAVSPLPHEP